MKDTVVAVVQARMTSSRLPGKVMADLAGQPLLARLLVRLERAECVDYVVVATTTNSSDDPVADAAKRAGVRVFRGGEQDVLGRVYGAAANLHATSVVRVTGDCPLVDPELVDACVRLQCEQSVDYASNVNRRTFPDGLDIEAMSMAALTRANREAQDPLHREHVTPYIRGDFPDLPGGDFTRADLCFQADFSHLRWTVDYQSDLERVRTFFEELPEPFGWLDALALATRRPELLGSRSSVLARGST